MRFSLNKFLLYVWLYKKLQLDQFFTYRHKMWHNDSLYNELQNDLRKFGNSI